MVRSQLHFQKRAGYFLLSSLYVFVVARPINSKEIALVSCGIRMAEPTSARGVGTRDVLPMAAHRTPLLDIRHQ